MFLPVPTRILVNSRELFKKLAEPKHVSNRDIFPQKSFYGFLFTKTCMLKRRIFNFLFYYVSYGTYCSLLNTDTLFI